MTESEADIPYDVWDIIAENSDAETILALCRTHPDFSYLCREVNSPLWSKLLERDFPGVEIRVYDGGIAPGNLKDEYELLRSDDYWINLIDNGEEDLRYAKLEGANLEGANLKWANLEGTHFEGTHFEGAYLKGAHLEGARQDEPLPPYSEEVKDP